MTTRATFRWPIVLGVLSTVGLVAGLLGAGLFDIACWVGLGVPVIMMARAWTHRG